MTVMAKGIDPKIVHYGIRKDDLARVEAISGAFYGLKINCKPSAEPNPFGYAEAQRDCKRSLK